jgi:hypothetical protein
MADDIAVLFPDREVSINGAAFDVAPIPFGRLPKAVKLALPLVHVLRESKIVKFAASEKGDEIRYEIAPDWAEKLETLLVDGGEPLMEFVAFAVNQPRTWLDRIRADEGIELVKAVFGVNSDLFVQRILPMLPGLGVNPRPAGEPSSPDSSAPATADETSTATA